MRSAAACASGRRRELSSDDGACSRCQSCSRCFSSCTNTRVARLRLRDAGDVGDFEVAVADQAGSSEFRQRLQGLRHEVVIAVDSE